MTDPRDTDRARLREAFVQVVHGNPALTAFLDVAMGATPYDEPPFAFPDDWTPEMRAAGTALLGFVNPTTDPTEIERRRIAWDAFEQGRKFEHRWCSALDVVRGMPAFDSVRGLRPPFLRRDDVVDTLRGLG